MAKRPLGSLADHFKKGAPRVGAGLGSPPLDTLFGARVYGRMGEGVGGADGHTIQHSPTQRFEADVVPNSQLRENPVEGQGLRFICPGAPGTHTSK
jgi:hypothetical protein